MKQASKCSISCYPEIFQRFTTLLENNCDVLFKIKLQLPWFLKLQRDCSFQLIPLKIQQGLFSLTSYVLLDYDFAYVILSILNLQGLVQ